MMPGHKDDELSETMDIFKRQGVPPNPIEGVGGGGTEGPKAELCMMERPTILRKRKRGGEGQNTS